MLWLQLPPDSFSQMVSTTPWTNYRYPCQLDGLVAESLRRQDFTGEPGTRHFHSTALDIIRSRIKEATK